MELWNTIDSLELKVTELIQNTLVCLFNQIKWRLFSYRHHLSYTANRKVMILLQNYTQ